MSNDWKPIETAPKDGSKILLFLMHGNGCVVAYWRKAHKTWDIPMHMVEICGTPTHWMPLPEEPITSTK